MICIHCIWQFIGFLVDQLARHRFLQVACHLERKTTNGAYELLRLVDAELQAYTSNTLGRIVRLLRLPMATRICLKPFRRLLYGEEFKQLCI